VQRSSLTASTCRHLGDHGEELAAFAFEKHGIHCSNLNKRLRKNFPFADLLLEKNGVFYAAAVKTRHRVMHNGRVNTRYKLNCTKSQQAVDKLRAVMGIEAVPAFITVEINGDEHSVYFGMLEDTVRTNGVGMREQERTRYVCLVQDAPHGRLLPRCRYK
jgi:Holliday junction resolvase-like predicted endonuclease